MFVHREAELTHKLELGKEEYTKKATEANNLSRQLKKVQVCVCACVPHIRTGGTSRSDVGPNTEPARSVHTGPSLLTAISACSPPSSSPSPYASPSPPLFSDHLRRAWWS